jgi:ABC-2 type transport system permease protein
MRVWWTLVRRELAGYFLSLTGYIIIAAALFLMGFSFVVLLVNLRQDPTPLPVTELFYITPFFWLILLLSTPVITMRLFAHEKFSGTFETLMTAPVSDLEVVLAKFTAAMAFYVVMWLPLAPCLLIVRHFSSEPAAFDFGAAGTTFLGILLLGGLFLSLGCCASSLTRSQVSAAMISLACGGSLFLLGVLAGQFPAGSGWQSQIVAAFSLFDQMHDFARGLIDTRSVVLLASLTFFFLFLTLRVVESRRWK